VRIVNEKNEKDKIPMEANNNSNDKGNDDLMDDLNDLEEDEVNEQSEEVEHGIKVGKDAHQKNSSNN
jgi:hypothetical protein